MSDNQSAMPQRDVQPPANSGTTGLVLPGGGARGAYQAGTLKALMEIASAGPNPFQVIMGASVGAINAVTLAARADDIRHGADQLVAFWSAIKPEQIFRTDLASVLATGAKWLAAMTPFGSLG
ncbi:MAG: patatin-like phospholipase family protein, partial [Hyphomicrobiaceae bacterium]